MEVAKLHYISQAAADGSHLTAIAKVLSKGVRWVQLRMKDQSANEVLQTALEAKMLCDSVGARLVINDFPEIAHLTGAYGVHLGLQDMPIKEARSLLGPDSCIGGTANTFEDVLKRASEGVDYIGLGPFRFTTTKTNLSPVLGLEGYRNILRQMRKTNIQIPVIAIGGIVQEDIEALQDLGVHGIAASGLLTKDNNLNEEFYVQYSR